MLSFSFLKGKKKSDNSSVNRIILKIKEGNEDLREQFIKDYNPFIIKSVSHICRKYIDIQNCEEYSVGLLAFNEAINCFDESKNSGFFNFAYQVLSRRLINYMKKNEKDSAVYPFSYFENENIGPLNHSQSSYNTVDPFERIEFSSEIISFRDELKSFGITIRDLIQSSPKHRDSRVMCIGIAKQIAENPHLFNKLLRTKNLPINELLNTVEVSRGAIEKNRKYIVAICIIVNSKLDLMKSYIQSTEQRGCE